MYKPSILFFVFVFFLQYSFSQNLLELVNSKKIDPDRYAGIDDSPYLFKHWLVGDVTNTEGEVVKEVFLNYNGFTEEFEVKNGENFIELENKLYSKIEISKKKNGDAFPKGAGEHLIFQRNLHDQFKDKFIRVLYQGPTLQVLQSFRTTVSETTTQDVGRTIEKKRFMGLRSFFVLKEGELESFNLKKSSIIKTFGYKKELDTFMRKQKINLDEVSDIAKLFAYYEELLSS